MSEASPIIYLKDYLPPAFLIDQVHLHIDLHDEATQVRSLLKLRRNPARPEKNVGLRLDGEAMELNAISLDGTPLSPEAYTVDESSLNLHSVPDQFLLETLVTIDPKNNTGLSGLYQSKGNYCTQC